MDDGGKDVGEADQQTRDNAETTKGAVILWLVRARVSPIPVTSGASRLSLSDLDRATDKDPGFLCLQRHATLLSTFELVVLSQRCLAMARLLARG